MIWTTCIVSSVCSILSSNSPVPCPILQFCFVSLKFYIKAGILCSSTQVSLELIPFTCASKTVISTLVFLHGCQRNEHFTLWVRGCLKDLGGIMGLFWWSHRKQMGREGVRNGKSSGLHMLMRRNLNGGQDLVSICGFLVLRMCE